MQEKVGLFLLVNMKQSDDLFAFKRTSLRKKKKKDSLSSSSSSSLGAAAAIAIVDEQDRRPSQGKIEDTLLTMGLAMENTLMGDEKEERKQKLRHRKRKEKKKNGNMEDEKTEEPTLVMNQLDFLQRRKLEAAQMRIRREMKKEKEHPTHLPLLDLHYLPPMLQDACTLNIIRFQTAQAWAKAQERVAEMKLNKSRQKKKDSLISNAKGLLKKTWKVLDKSTSHFTRFKLWAKDLKWMECSFGSSMMITFAFLRWVFLLNLSLGLIWFCAIVLPFILHPPKVFDWTTFKATLAGKKLLLALQGIGIDKSFLFYGGYLYAKDEQFGWYHTDYMYPLTIVATILISLLAILGRITIRILQSGSKTLGASGNVLYPFATLTFATWDFHLTTFEGATIMRRGIQMQFCEHLADDKNRKKETNEKMGTLLKRYLALFLLWPILLVISTGCEYYLVRFENEISDRVGYLVER